MDGGKNQTAISIAEPDRLHQLLNSAFNSAFNSIHDSTSQVALASAGWVVDDNPIVFCVRGNRRIYFLKH